MQTIDITLGGMTYPDCVDTHDGKPWAQMLDGEPVRNADLTEVLCTLDLTPYDQACARRELTAMIRAL